MSNPASNLVATRAAYPSMLRSPCASMRSLQTASGLGTRRTLQINSKGEVQAVPTRSGTGIRSIEVYYGHLNARTGGPLIIDPLQKKSYDAVSAANPFAIDPAKITVEPGVSYLPSPIKLDGHATGVVAKAVNGNCSARRT